MNQPSNIQQTPYDFFFTRATSLLLEVTVSNVFLRIKDTTLYGLRHRGDGARSVITNPHLMINRAYIVLLVA